jgi:hypothetical protein
MKETFYDYVKVPELVVKLKEFGYDLDEEWVYWSLPYSSMGRSGYLKDGEIPDCYYHSVKETVKILDDLKECNIVARLRERGYEVEEAWIKHFPRKKEKDKYYYDIEIIVALLNSISHHNLQAKLEERGYKMDKEAIYDIYLNSPSQYNSTKYEFKIFDLDKVIQYIQAPKEKDLQRLLKERGYDLDNDYITHLQDKYLGHDSETGYTCIKIDPIIQYINSVNEYNLPSKLKERGYDIDATDLSAISEERDLSSYNNFFEEYDLEKVIAFLDENPPQNIMKIMEKKTDERGTTNLFGDSPKDFFSESSNGYSHFPIMKWYAEKFNTIPDICFTGVVSTFSLLDDYATKIKWYFKALVYDEHISDCHSHKVLRSFSAENKRENITEALIELEEGYYLLLFEGHHNYENCEMYANSCIFYKEGKHDISYLLRYLADQYVVHTERGSLGLLFHDHNGFNTVDFKIPQPEIDFNLHYNKGFKEVHNTILTALNRGKGKGLVLLHGKPGTGKTSYIRYLINSVSKNKIFVPPNLTEVLSDPGFIPFLISNPDCILFVEDAENVLRSREDHQNNQAVSNVLNITDGLLSDCLNIQIVATFNTNLKNVDPALLRKGRLIAQYEFDELAPERAEKLADHLKVWLDNTSHLTLADIYATKAAQQPLDD